VRLTHHLLLTTAGCALVALLVAMAVLLTLEHRNAMAQLQHLADTGERILRTQLIGLREGVTLDARFPDWSAMTEVARGDGSCFKLEHANGQPWRSDCRGAMTNGAAVPAWFADSYRLLFAPARRVTRDITRGRELHGRLAVTVDGDAEIARSWTQTQRMAGLTAAVVLSLCLALSFFMTRALRPLADIVAQLEGLANGERQARLGPLAHTELHRIAVASDTLAETLARLEHERAQLSLRLLEVQEHERRELARDLHDEFGQHLTAVAATIATVRRGLHDDQAALEDALERSADSIAQLHGLVREVLTRLRPPGIDELGLCAAVTALAADWQRRCGGRPAVHSHCDKAFDALPAPLAAEILRIVQECTINAVRHADASLIVITLACGDGSYEVEISDDGRGGDAPATGFGLNAVRERAAACAGSLDIHHGTGGGLTVKLSIPATNLAPTP
jgi:signal transduction histidine kinase